jgi:hypothetical protein
VARVPAQAALAAQTDQALAEVADGRAGLKGDNGALTALSAEATAKILAAEFPCVAELGRILVATSGALLSLRHSLDERGVDADTGALLSVLALAGEQLDREARDGQ